MITKIDILKVTGRSEKEKLPRYIPDEYSEKRFGKTQIHSYTHQCLNFLFCFLGFGHIV